MLASRLLSYPLAGLGRGKRLLSTGTVLYTRSKVIYAETTCRSAEILHNGVGSHLSCLILCDSISSTLCALFSATISKSSGP